MQPPEPHAPSNVSILWNRALDAWNIFSRINGTLWASSFSYYAFFALFPLLAFLVSMAAHFMDSEQAFKLVSSFAGRFMPLDHTDREMIAQTVDGVINSRGKFGLISLAGLMWSAIGFFQAATGAVNAAWCQEPLSWWHMPLKNMLMLLLLISAILLGALGLAALKTILGLKIFVTKWPNWAVHLANWMVTTGVLFYGFLFFYRFAPRRVAAVTFSDVCFPALLVALLLQLAQRAFVIYAADFGNFNAVYGTFGVVIALMLWIYLSGVVIVMGGCYGAAASGRVCIEKTRMSLKAKAN